MKLVDTLNYLKANHNERLAQKMIDKHKKTGNDKFAKKALYHLDKAEDQKMLATAPHANKKDAREHIKARRDEIEDARMKDWLKTGNGKEFYED